MVKRKTASIVVVHTDGSFYPDTKVGSWCAHIEEHPNRFFMCGIEENTTNNRVELLAVINALEYFKTSKTFHIYSDSQYVVNPIEKEWVYMWNNNCWRSSTKSEIKNIDLWKKLLKLLKKHTVKMFWIRGHDGINLNEQCDTLSKLIITNIYKKYGK